MARKSQGKRQQAFSETDYTAYLFPSVIGGVIAWVLSGSMGLGIIVFVALMMGNYFGTIYRNNR